MRVCIRRDASQGSGTRVEIESRGQRITLAASEGGSGAGVQVSGVERFEQTAPATVGAFTLTPFVANAASGEAYAVLVEGDGAALLYAGDLQVGMVQRLLAAPPPHVDALLMDSAAVGWGISPEPFPSETDFEEKFVALFRQTQGLPLVWCSRQNVDRIHTIYRACQRTSRQFIVDLSTAELLRSPLNQHVAQAVGDRIRVFISARKLRKLSRKEAPELAGISDASRIYPEQLSGAAATSVMLFRPSLMRDLEQAKCLAGARLIFSIWQGYLEYEKSNPVLEWLEQHDIPLEQCHAAGHAGIRELIRLRQAFRAAPVTPLRSRQPGRFDELFGGVQRRANGEWFEIVPMRSGTV